MARDTVKVARRAFLAGLFFVFGCFGLLSETMDVLWGMATAIARENEDWVAGLVELSVEEFTIKGVLKSSRAVSYRLLPAEDGEIESRLVRYVEDGQDVTEQKQDTDQSQGGGFLWGIEETPFSPGVSEGLVVRRNGEHAEVAGKSCAVFVFEFNSREDEIMVGTAWLDEVSGAPLKMEIGPKDLPRFVHELSSTVYYDHWSPKQWYPSRVSIEATGGMLLFKRAFKMEMVLSEHWQRPVSSSSD